MAEVISQMAKTNKSYRFVCEMPVSLRRSGKRLLARVEAT
jgi:hypothetical protein